MIFTATVKTKCDVKNCKNDAEYFFETKGRNGKCFLCKHCYDALASDALKKRVPKSPKNTIRKLMDEKEESRAYGKD